MKWESLALQKKSQGMVQTLAHQVETLKAAKALLDEANRTLGVDLGNANLQNAMLEAQKKALEELLESQGKEVRARHSKKGLSDSPVRPPPS